MTTQQKISAILKQENYRVENGKVLRYDQLEDKFKPVIVSSNRIPLVKTGSVVEIFLWDDVAACIKELNGAAWKISGDIHGHEMKTMGTVDTMSFPIHTKNKLIAKIDTSEFPIDTKDKSDLLVKVNKAKNVKEVKKVIVKFKKQIMAKKKKAETKTKSNRKPSVNLNEEHIAFIKKEHNKGTSKMAIARLLSEKTGMDVTRFIVMYHVKKIDAKKK